MKKIICHMILMLVVFAIFSLSPVYARMVDDNRASVIVLFQSEPAAVQAAKAQNDVQPFSVANAESIVEAEHAMFRQELSELFGVQAFAEGQGYEIRWEYRQALNGVSLILPAHKVSALYGFESVRAVIPNAEIEIDIPAPEQKHPTELTALRNPQGALLGRATMRANDMHNLGYRGEGIVVAVIDTGIDWNHLAFEGAFLTLEQMQQRNPNITEADIINGYFKGRNFREGEALNDPMELLDDWGGHGTPVAGVILGRDSGRSVGVLGVAPRAKMFAYRVSDNLVLVDGLLAAINMTAYDKPDIVNISMGTRFPTSPMGIMSIAVNNIKLANPDMVFVIAAGNSYENYTVWSPGNSTTAITVASADISWQLEISISDFSSRGPVGRSFEIKPDITVHGRYVQSAMPQRRYHTYRGTSFAAPHVSGAVALLMQYSRENFGASWTAEEIKARIMNAAMQVGDYSVFATGAGYIDVYAAAHADTMVYVYYPFVATDPAVRFEYQDFKTVRTGSFSFGGYALFSDERMGAISRTLSAVIENHSQQPRYYTITYRFLSNPDGAASLEFYGNFYALPGGTAAFDATINIAAGADFGFYEGFIYVNTDGERVAALPFAFVLQDDELPSFFGTGDGQLPPACVGFPYLFGFGVFSRWGLSCIDVADGKLPYGLDFERALSFPITPLGDIFVIIIGVPQETGIFNFTVRVENMLGAAYHDFSLEVRVCPYHDLRTELGELIRKSQALLDSTKVSVTGQEISFRDYWAIQAEHNAFDIAIGNAALVYRELHRR